MEDPARMTVFQVRVEGIRFDAAHFATFGGKCEPLHGHSYEVAAEVEGDLSSDSWVVDFGRLKRLLRKMARELDHRFLLQCHSQVLQIHGEADAWRISTQEGISYVFPRKDVAPLPVDNITAERLCEWFAGRLWKSLQNKGVRKLRSVNLEVWEGPSQRASHRLECLPLD